MKKHQEAPQQWHMKKVETNTSTACVKNRLCPYLRNFTLYLTRHPVSLSPAHRGSGIWKQSCRPTVHSIDQVSAWRGGGVSPLSAASRSHQQPVKTHRDKDMHSWSRMAVFRAGISWLCQEWCCSLGSNFFPWVKVRNGLQSEPRHDCQLHWSQETSPHPRAPWLLTLTALSLPSSLKSWNFITSAIMKPFSKSVWIFPAACGALVPFCHREEKERTNELFWRRWITACRRQGVWWGR